MRIAAEINGRRIEETVGPGETLLEALRRLGYTSVKDGCAHGDCGTCAVLLNGRAVASCLMFAGQAHGARITTIEGLPAEKAHPLQQAMLETGGVQCGYCIPAMILTAADLLRRNATPTRAEIAAYLAGNLCRCTGYVKQLDAVELVVESPEGGAHG